ncbi:MAG TPA: putative metal-binding motif-containing protein, partial [Myxococcota bacterium]|nr:putative metal-binding motif-containing protein [Myxococcota bacterium]
YRDIDGDGYYPTGAASYTGCDQPPGYARTPGDCDDGNAAISPAAQEICDALNVDEDCDGLADDADPSVSGQGQWYTDADGDGYAPTGGVQVTSCDAPANAATATGDCDDTNPAISPAASEVCDALDVDEDCDGLTEDADPSVSGQQTWYRDNDGDGYAAIGAATLVSCDTQAGYVSSGGDCDDSLASVSPAGTEVCDSLDRDEDCDGLADDDDPGATGQSTVYQDADYDGFGGTTIVACDPSGNTVSNADDCDDTDVQVNPLEAEVCSDGIDNDCDGVDDPCSGCNPNNPTVTISTLNYNGMSYYMLSLDPCLPYYSGSCCAPTTNQEEADAFCQLAGYCEATNFVVELKQSTSCYCHGACTNNTWYSPCCSGSDTRYFITEVTCR